MGAIAVRQPVGVVACITPYNFPIVNMAGKIGPALAMGNTVVVKPAPQDPLAVIKLVEVMNEAGFPPELWLTAAVFAVSGVLAARLPRHVDVPTGEQPAAWTPITATSWPMSSRPRSAR